MFVDNKINTSFTDASEKMVPFTYFNSDCCDNHSEANASEMLEHLVT